jgi:hypothetical protein
MVSIMKLRNKWSLRIRIHGHYSKGMEEMEQYAHNIEPRSVEGVQCLTCLIGW